MFNWFKKNDKPKKPKLSDAKPGDKIRITWCGTIGKVKVLNNDPDKRRVFFQIWYIGGKTESLVYDYHDEIFKDFSLLNGGIDMTKPTKSTKRVDDNNNIIELQKQMNDAIESENYELANQIQKRLDKLAKK